jgi:hypothetical protein
MSSEAAGQLANVLIAAGIPATIIVTALLCWYGARHQTRVAGGQWGPWKRGGSRCGEATFVLERGTIKLWGVARARSGERALAPAIDVRRLEAGDLALLEAELRDRLAAEAEDAQAAGPRGEAND